MALAILPPDTIDEIKSFAAELNARFTPPEFVPGCEVKDITDKDQYDSDNGWIEAVVGQHNQQRCRWRGQFANVQVGDIVDVLYFASYRLFVVYGQGGTGSISGSVLNNYAGTATPGAGDDSGDGYSVGSHWVDTTNDASYILADDTAGSAVWLQTGPTTGLLKVTNSSGSAANANDAGYIDANGDYQTTITAEDLVPWCVVITGGANGADILVANRGRVTVAYTGSAPADGDFLTTSTVAGSAQARSTMHHAIFARCQAAGSGGTVEALLLTQTNTIIKGDSDKVMSITSSDNSDFVSTVAAAGVSGDKVYYTAPSSGAVSSITPSATTELGKIVLHNTSQTQEAFIIATGTDGTGDFIQVSDSADISGWASAEDITARSQTNTLVATDRYFDLDLAEENVTPELARYLILYMEKRDSGAAGEFLIVHPFEAFVGANQDQLFTTGASSEIEVKTGNVSLIQRRFGVRFSASGTGTQSSEILLRGYGLATP